MPLVQCGNRILRFAYTKEGIQDAQAAAKACGTKVITIESHRAAVKKNGGDLKHPALKKRGPGY